MNSKRTIPEKSSCFNELMAVINTQLNFTPFSLNKIHFYDFGF